MNKLTEDEKSIIRELITKEQVSIIKNSSSTDQESRKLANYAYIVKLQEISKKL